MAVDQPTEESLPRRPVATFKPRSHPLLPVEVISRSEIRRRRKNANLGGRHTHDFHQLIVCHGGDGFHHVDREQIAMHPGRVLHIHPGQTHEYQFDPDFQANVVVYRAGVFRTSTPSGEWFPGAGPSMLWDFARDDFDEITSVVADIRAEEARFDGSVLSVMLIESLLATLLVRLLRQPTKSVNGEFPEAFLLFSQLLEDNFRTRPTIAWFAQQLGYSTRTLDRVCNTAVGRSAKSVLDDRVNLDISRLLTDTDTPIKQISSAFGFTDPASFSKYVDRHLGKPPTQIRQTTRR